MGKRNFVEFFSKEQGECVGGDKVVLDKVRSYGFDCVELSFSHDDYFKKYRFTEGDNAEQLFQYCESIGLKIWSIHLPFSDVWDLSCDDAQKALQDDVKLLEAAGRANISVAVIHPSFEPIAEEARNKQAFQCKKEFENIKSGGKRKWHRVSP